jgi:tRNA A-37 threonylcarbamoyl transferase component Bud32
MSLPGLVITGGFPGFTNLPWDKPLADWSSICSYISDAPKGLSRHIVIFVNYENDLYTLKELHLQEAEREFHYLQRIEALRLPVIKPVGYYQAQDGDQRSILVTKFLDFSLPYRTLFMQDHLSRYRNHLMDAMAGLLVQLHLSGVYWGDCSFSNTLFRRDAGMLQAYMVDAETVEFSSGIVPPVMRSNDLVVMEENLGSDLEEISEISQVAPGIPTTDIAVYIRVKYHELWEEVTREEEILPDDSLRIQERIRALNRLGFSVNGIELAKTSDKNLARLKVVVSDRNYHRDLLFSLTGIDAQETQAQLIMNELQEMRVRATASQGRDVSMSEAAFNWLADFYQVVCKLMLPHAGKSVKLPEIYCQVLEHKWFLSEKAQRDVGHIHAAQDYIKLFLDRNVQA